MDVIAGRKCCSCHVVVFSADIAVRDLVLFQIYFFWVGGYGLYRYSELSALFVIHQIEI